MNNQPSMVAFLSGDLMFASRVKAAAENAGHQFHFGGSLPTENTKSIRYVILDLATRSGLTASIVADCGEQCPDAKLIAYGPHVQVAKLTAAKAAGIPIVLTRGQFDSKLSTLFDEAT